MYNFTTHQFLGFTRYQGYQIAHVYCPVHDKEVETLFVSWDEPQRCDLWDGCGWVEEES